MGDVVDEVEEEEGISTTWKVLRSGLDDVSIENDEESKGR